MHSDRDAYIGMPSREAQRSLARGEVFSSTQDADDACFSRARERVGEVIGETSVCEVRVGVDHHARLTFIPWPSASSWRSHGLMRTVHATWVTLRGWGPPMSSRAITACGTTTS